MKITAPNGYQALFRGLDDVEKIKSTTPEVGVLTDVIIEEATETAKDAVKQLKKRLRGKSKVKKRITYLYNPVYKTHWLYTDNFPCRFYDNSKTYRDDELSILKTTYLDNLRFLEKDDIRELENEKDEYYKNVYTYGNWGVLGKLVYNNWKVQDLTEIRDCFSSYNHGVDFGFFPDPAAYIKMAYHNQKIYIIDEEYGREWKNKELADNIRPHVKKDIVLCDSAEPKSIEELKGYEINAAKAMKGPDSKRFSIKWISGKEIIVDPRCQNYINEIGIYQYKKDQKTGLYINDPIKKNDHLMDAKKYGLSREIRGSAFGGGNI
jgi:phage terminase large subunit